MALYIGPGAGETARIDAFLNSFQIRADEAQDGWKTFTSAEGKFTVRMPGTPKSTVSDLANGGKIYQFVLDKGDYAYIVSYNAIAEPEPEAVPALLNKTRDAMVSSLKGKLVEEKQVKLGDNPGKAIRVAMAASGGTAHVRGYIVGSRYYQVMLLGSDKALGAANADRYFASFQLAPGSGSAFRAFGPKDGRFTVEMPGEPTKQPINATTMKYVVDAGDTVYIVVYVDLKTPVDGPEEVNRALQVTKDAELKALDATELSQKEMKLGDSPGLQATFSIPPAKIPGGGSGIERFFLDHNRIFEVAVITSKQKTTDAMFARFFDSFKISPPASPAP
jgi:hypothetical protein